MTVAKFQVTAIFLVQDVRRNFLPKFIEVWFIWRRDAGAHPDGQFCYKSVNLSLEELINIKIILFIIPELFR